MDRISEFPFQVLQKAWNDVNYIIGHKITCIFGSEEKPVSFKSDVILIKVSTAMCLLEWKKGTPCFQNSNHCWCWFKVLKTNFIYCSRGKFKFGTEKVKY